MIKKIIIFLIFLLIPNISTAKAPPLGTGSLVPANIMIMLDNSGSMAWDLGGTPLSSTSDVLHWPTWIDHDSKGNLYVMNTPIYYSDKFIQVFEPDGTFVKGIKDLGNSFEAETLVLHKSSKTNKVVKNKIKK